MVFSTIHLLFAMSHTHEREGIITLTKDHILPVDSVFIPEDYRVLALGGS